MERHKQTLAVDTLEESDYLDTSESGFRPGYSSEMALIT